MVNDPSRSPLSGIKVMVIDDSNTIRRSAEIFLLQAGCTVILAEDGFDALAKIADHQPELVFVDIMMPRLDGYQTCALIKKNSRFHAMPVVMPGLTGCQATRAISRDPGTKSIPVIMCTSKSQETDKIWGLRQGARDYVVKPVDRDELLAKISSLG